MLGEFLYGSQYHLYVPPSHLEDLKVRYRITTQTTMTETEQPISSGIVIFGATGDLCKRKLIPALYKLWGGKNTPRRICNDWNRQERSWCTWHGKNLWAITPEEFLHHLDYVSTDLDNPESSDTSSRLSTRQYLFLICSSREIRKCRHPPQRNGTPRRPRSFQSGYRETPLGTILNLLVIYSLWWGDIYARSKSIALDHYLGKDTVNNILATRFRCEEFPLYFGTNLEQSKYRDEVRKFLRQKVTDEMVALNIFTSTSRAVRRACSRTISFPQVLRSIVAMEPPCVEWKQRRFAVKKQKFLPPQECHPQTQSLGNTLEVS